MCSMLSNMSRMQTGSLYAAMNELSNHDHSRFLTRTNRVVGRLYKPEDAENAEIGVNYGTFPLRRADPDDMAGGSDDLLRG